MSQTLPDRLVEEIREILSPLSAAIEHPFWLTHLFGQLGIDPEDEGLAALVPALEAVNELREALTALAQSSSPSLADIDRLLRAAGDAFTAIRALGAGDELTAQFAGIGPDLIQFLVGWHLAVRYPLLFHLGVLLTLIEPAHTAAPTQPVVVGGELLRAPAVFPRIQLDRLIPLIRDPAAVLRAAYVNDLATVDDANAMADELFPRIASVLGALDVSSIYGIQENSRELLGPAAPLVDHSLLIYLLKENDGAPADAGVSLSLSSADRGDLGLVVSPFGSLTYTQQAGDWTIEASSTAEVDAFAVGRHGFTLAANGSTASVDLQVAATLAAREGRPGFIFGTPTGSRLEVGGAALKLSAALSEAAQVFGLSADVSSSAFILARGDGDSFIDSILPAQGIRTDFDLGLAWSTATGLRLRGKAGLEADIPVGRSFAGITLSSLFLSLQARDDQLVTELSARLSASIGPLSAAVDRVGLAATLSFPPGGGDGGVAQLDFGFQPPLGVGIAVDASAVTGGGYLGYDPAKAEYSGILQLEIADKIAVKAIGLLTTRLPDGGKGYSLVLIIFVEGFAPIQLGYGFALTGIGGLLAINRTFDEEALRAGLKDHTLDSLLFPQAPILNAPQILSNLNKVFPPANGHHLFGPMVQIAWPTPALITADVGVVLELGARLRLLILAQVVAILPKRENDLVRLQMDAIGVLDFDQGTAALDATLHGSRLLKFVLTGDMAMRLKWEGSPNFALAVGGLHPAFNPPTNFPKLERVAINLSAGDNPRIRCEAYFALTANTVQFGARAELYAAAAGFSIQGEFGYDVLIQRDPFHFLADFYAQLQLKRNSTNLFKVRVEGALAGPRPLHLKGKATFEILWWDYSIRIDTTLVEGELPPPPEPIDVLPQLKEALGNPGNWMSQLPAGQRPMVTLRGKPGAAATDVLLHPLGTLTVKQSVVPLNMDISLFGQAAPAGARRFTISSVSLGGQSPATQSVPDFFAPAQFFEMSDDEKLSRPSFEPMPAGVSIGSSTFVFNADDCLEVKGIEFETWIVDKEKNETRPSHPEDQKNVYALSRELLDKQARFGAAANSDIRRTGKAKYRTTMDKHKVVKEGWSIVATDDLTVQPVPGIEDGKPRIYSEAKQALRKLKQADPAKATGLKIVRLSEVREID